MADPTENNTETNLDVEDETKSEDLVRDYLLHQLQLNLLHSQFQDKPYTEAVEELMEAKRTMQEMEENVVKKFTALNEQYERINDVIDPEKVRGMEKYHEMLKEIHDLTTKHQGVLDNFDNDAGAYLENHQAITEELAQLTTEVDRQKELIASLVAQISAVDSNLRSD